MIKNLETTLHFSYTGQDIISPKIEEEFPIKATGLKFGMKIFIWFFWALPILLGCFIGLSVSPMITTIVCYALYTLAALAASFLLYEIGKTSYVGSCDLKDALYKKVIGQIKDVSIQRETSVSLVEAIQCEGPTGNVMRIRYEKDGSSDKKFIADMPIKVFQSIDNYEAFKRAFKAHSEEKLPDNFSVKGLDKLRPLSFPSQLVESPITYTLTFKEAFLTPCKTGVLLERKDVFLSVTQEELKSSNTFFKSQAFQVYLDASYSECHRLWQQQQAAELAKAKFAKAKAKEAAELAKAKAKEAEEKTEE